MVAIVSCSVHDSRTPEPQLTSPRLVPPLLASQPPPTPPTLASLLQLTSPPLQPLSTLPTRLTSPQQWLAPPPRFASPQQRLALPPHSSPPLLASDRAALPAHLSPLVKERPSLSAQKLPPAADLHGRPSSVRSLSQLPSVGLRLEWPQYASPTASSLQPARPPLASSHALPVHLSPQPIVRCLYLFQPLASSPPHRALGATTSVASMFFGDTAFARYRQPHRARVGLRPCARRTRSPRLRRYNLRPAPRSLALSCRERPPCAQPSAVTLPRWLRAWGGVECRRLVF